MTRTIASRFKTLSKTAALTLAATAPLAHAELTANVALTSNYKFRGQDQDASHKKAFKPALQGGFDYSFGDSGFYVGNWNSSVDWLAGNSLESDFFGGYKAKTVASKYPNVARQFFESRAMDVRIIKIEGSVELAPLLGLADGIVDIVETGTTLKENGLEVTETIAGISARLIANTASLKMRKQEIEALAARMEAQIEKNREEKSV